MTDDERPKGQEPAAPSLSKRGARRVIQRAFVLVGRERSIRQHIRQVELNTCWGIADWGLEWTVVIDHGRLDFHRGHIGRPQVTYYWETGERFLEHVESKTTPEKGFELVSDPVWRRVVEPVFNSFLAATRAVLADPVDDDGERIL
ncbi:MAG: hypothetical protein ACE145_15660 [Terriglobia bacterium]